jgi:aminoglycoside phosphotransferase (APT) family kinase protein
MPGPVAIAHGLQRTLGAAALAFAEPPTPLAGGFDTAIYAFRLRQAPPAFAGPLVLRLLRPHQDPGRVLRERATQNAVADQGYPAPRVLLACTEAAPLGAPFAIMQRLPGAPLTERVVGMGAVLVDAQHRLHALDPAPLRAVLPDFDRYLDGLAGRIDAAALDGVRPLLDWLRARRPRPPVPTVICHGDLHPQNVLVQGGALTGVLDWPNAVLAEPAFDVAATLSILRCVPVELVVPGPLRWLARAGQPILAARYLAGYRRRRPVDAARLAYYEVAAALRAIVRSGENRRGGRPGPSSLDTSSYVPRLLARLARITGRAATLPA